MKLNSIPLVWAFIESVLATAAIISDTMCNGQCLDAPIGSQLLQNRHMVATSQLASESDSESAKDLQSAKDLPDNRSAQRRTDGSPAGHTTPHRRGKRRKKLPALIDIGEPDAQVHMAPLRADRKLAEQRHNASRTWPSVLPSRGAAGVGLKAAQVDMQQSAELGGRRPDLITATDVINRRLTALAATLGEAKQALEEGSAKIKSAIGDIPATAQGALDEEHRGSSDNSAVNTTASKHKGKGRSFVDRKLRNKPTHHHVSLARKDNDGEIESPTHTTSTVVASLPFLVGIGGVAGACSCLLCKRDSASGQRSLGVQAASECNSDVLNSPTMPMPPASILANSLHIIDAPTNKFTSCPHRHRSLLGADGEESENSSRDGLMPCEPKAFHEDTGELRDTASTPDLPMTSDYIQDTGSAYDSASTPDLPSTVQAHRICCETEAHRICTPSESRSSIGLEAAPETNDVEVCPGQDAQDLKSMTFMVPDLPYDLKETHEVPSGTNTAHNASGTQRLEPEVSGAANLA
jgi:hypothetical protein